jgi:uncharacterized protein YegL
MAEIDVPDEALLQNNSQRLPCVLLIDASGSMAGSPIAELNAGLRLLESELKSDDVASQRVQLMVIQFGGVDSEVRVLVDWTDAMDFSAPTLEAGGLTPMGEAVQLALQKLEEQKQRYRTHGIPYNRPWVFLLTDGAPNPGWEPAASANREAEQAGKLTLFGIGIGEADLNTLAKFSTRPPVRLQGLKFRELFLWLSRSTSIASQSAQGSNVQLAPPTDWMQVSV